MKTYTESGSETSNETELAIARSISHNEIVRIECEDPSALTDWIEANYDDVDHARENDGDIDVWGKRSGEDFRIRVGKSDLSGQTFQYSQSAYEPDFYQVAKSAGWLTASVTSGTSPFNEWYAFATRSAAVDFISANFKSQTFLDNYAFVDGEIYDYDSTESNDDCEITVKAGSKPADLTDIITAESRF
jgi:hypothetical protein